MITHTELRNIRAPASIAIQIEAKAAITVGSANIAVQRYKTIVVRTIMSSEKKGDYVDKKVIGSGSGTQPNWYDIKHYGFDSCNWQNVDWRQMKSKGGTGLQLGGAEIRVKGWKGGLSWFKAEIQLSKQTGTDLKNMNYRLVR